MRLSERTGVATFLALALVIAASRCGHFGLETGLPDGSLAAFFLAGAGIAHAGVFVALALEVALLDALALAAGVSAACVTPAYILLFVGYGLLFALGRRMRSTAASWPAALAWLALGATVAFTMANAGYFALSGRFDGMSAADYTSRVARYLPMYVVPTLAYGAAGLAALRALSRRSAGIDARPR